jgi:alpha-L-fucosidase 2
MILQSHEGELSLLPALPASWTAGEVSGLRARGGFEVGLKWTAGRLDRATLVSKLGGVCRVRSSVPLTVASQGKTVAASKPERGVVEFKTTPGGTYTLAAAK